MRFFAVQSRRCRCALYATKVLNFADAAAQFVRPRCSISGDVFTFSDEELAQTEKAIGWKLPKSYVALLKIRNGGRIDYEKFEDCWLAEIYGITPRDGLIEMFDNWINEWEHPNIGIPFGQTESAGHDMYFMDFGSVDENGEPRIVLIDNEFDNCVTEVAKNLEEFLTKIYNREEM